MTSRTFTLTPEEIRIFARREFTRASRWAASSLVVQDGPFRGSLMRLSVSPYIILPLDKFSAPDVEMISFCGSLQIGKTLFLYACIGYAIDHLDGMMMLTMPTEKTRDKVVARKLVPLLRGSPALRRHLGKKTREGIELKNGQALLFGSAESPGDRASITIQYMFIDEEDLYMPGNTSARPVDDFIGRTRSYGIFRKVVRVCQPKGQDSGIFKAVTQEADQLFCYELRCPACLEYHLPSIDNVFAKGGETDPGEVRRLGLGRYRCACGYEWSDHIRDLAVQAGRWAPYKWSDDGGFKPAPLKDKIRHYGFHAPSIISRQVSLSHLAAEKLKVEASDDEAVKQQFYNDELALPYSPVLVQGDRDLIRGRATPGLPRGVVPHGAVALALGADMQKYGFWFLVRAFMPDMSSYIIDHGRILAAGDLSDWEMLTEFCWNTYYPVQAAGEAGMPQSTGELMPFWRGALDTGGTEAEGVYTRTEEAYLWAREYGGGVFFAAKGASRAMSAPITPTVIDRLPQKRTPIPGGLTLYMLDTVKLKALAMRRLTDPDAKYPIRLYEDPDPDLLEQLTAEKMVRKGGKDSWVKTREKNHLLDCLMQTQACADPTWQPSLHMLLYQERLAREQAAATPPARENKKSRDRNRRGRI